MTKIIFKILEILGFVIANKALEKKDNDNKLGK